MKFIVAVFLTALLSFSWVLFFPWWIIAVVAFLVALVIPQTAFKSFLSAFLALVLLWGEQAIVKDIRNNHLLASKVASILPFGGSYIAVILVTAILGGLVAGLGALTGSFLRLPKT